MERYRRWAVKCVSLEDRDPSQATLGIDLLPCDYTGTAEIRASWLEHQIRVQRIWLGDFEDDDDYVARAWIKRAIWSFGVPDGTNKLRRACDWRLGQTLPYDHPQEILQPSHLIKKVPILQGPLILHHGVPKPLKLQELYWRSASVGWHLNLRHASQCQHILLEAGGKTDNGNLTAPAAQRIFGRGQDPARPSARYRHRNHREKRNTRLPWHSECP